MGYESQIYFTLDTICPWTYLAKRRLEKALKEVRSRDPPVTFTVYYRPYQLFADAPEHGEDKYEWYKKTRYNDSDEQMKKYITLMTAYGLPEGIDFKFGGQVASTFNAHRVIQYFQEEKGAETADKLVSALYNLYFENEQHPSSKATLLEACKRAGIDEKEATQVIDDESEGKQETKLAIREQAGNGIDAVPNITFEGKRRDFTLQGAKEVAEYIKTLESIIKEAN